VLPAIAHPGPGRKTIGRTAGNLITASGIAANGK